MKMILIRQEFLCAIIIMTRKDKEKVNRQPALSNPFAQNKIKLNYLITYRSIST